MHFYSHQIKRAMTDKRNDCIQVWVGETRSFLRLLRGAWVTQVSAMLKSLPHHWMITHESCITGVLWATCRQLWVHWSIHPTAVYCSFNLEEAETHESCKFCEPPDSCKFPMSFMNLLSKREYIQSEENHQTFSLSPKLKFWFLLETFK